MRFQERIYSCGPAALRAALYTLGRIVKESTIRRIAKTTPKKGTDEKGLFRAIKHYGYSWREYHDKDPSTGWNRIKRNLRLGCPSLLCISVLEPEDHWVSAVGLNGDNVMIFDPMNPDCASKKYSSIQIIDIDSFYSKWAYVDDNGITKYYSIVIRKDE